MNRPRIAVIEDDQELRELLVEILTDAGYDVTAVAGEVAALRQVVDARPHLLLVDIALPDGPGQTSAWDLVKELRDQPGLAGVPVIVSSGDLAVLRERADESRGDEAIAVLPKPFGIEDLERVVRELLRVELLPTWDDERDLVLVADADARLIDGSAAMLRVLGLSLDELRERTVSDIVAESGAWAATEWSRYRAEGDWAGAVMLRTASGEQLPARSVAETVHGARSQWYVARIELLDPPR